MTLSTPATKIASQIDLEKSAILIPTQINIVQNEQIDYLQRNILEIKNNDIPIVIFTTPLSQSYLDNISDSDKQNLKHILDEISVEFNIPIYNFTNNYASLDIWADPSHVAFNKNSIIYSDDVANMILNEIDS